MAVGRLLPNLETHSLGEDSCRPIANGNGLRPKLRPSAPRKSSGPTIQHGPLPKSFHRSKACLPSVHLRIPSQNGNSDVARSNTMAMNRPSPNSESGARRQIPPEVDREALMARARQMLFERRRRIQLFGAGMFSETGWDVLLALYGQRFGARISIGKLTDLTGAAPTTVLRWIVFLEERNFVHRTPSSLDRRYALLELTDRARRLLDLYFSETL